MFVADDIIGASGHLTSIHAGFSVFCRRVFVLTAWLLGMAAGYLVMREATLLLRQVRDDDSNTKDG